MTHSDSRPNQDLSDELSALRAIVEGTAGHTGQKFFQSLVHHLAAAVGTAGVKARMDDREITQQADSHVFGHQPADR